MQTEIPGLYGKFHRFLKFPFQFVEKSFNYTLHEKYNIFYFLGAIPIILLTILTITGLILFVAYTPSFDGAYKSLQHVTENTLVGKYIRTVHRYSANLMMFFVILHLLRVFAEGKYQQFRRLAWITGVIILAIMLIQGITGYMMIMDVNSQLVMEKTADFLASTKILGDDLARAFSLPGISGKWLIWIILIVHFFIPLFTIILTYIHIKRFHRPKLFGTKPIIFFTVLLVVGFSIAFPLKMSDAASPDKIPYMQSPDLYYLFLADIANQKNSLFIFLCFGAIMMVLLAVPWYKKPEKLIPAIVNKDTCNGCSTCATDCPFHAIDMQRREEGSNKIYALVDPSVCASCGICVGSCDFVSTSLSGDTFADQFNAPGQIIAVSCRQHSGAIEKQLTLMPNVRTVSLPCSGAFGPTHLKEVNKSRPQAVLLFACPQGDCYYREGNTWLKERLASERKPRFRKFADEQIPMYLFQTDYANAPAIIREYTANKEKYTSGEQLQRKIQRERKPWYAVPFTMLFGAFFIWFIFLTMVHYSKLSAVKPQNARVVLDFYLLTDVESCDLSKINPEEREKALSRMQTFIKRDNVSKEAQKRMDEMAEASLASKFCTRRRRTLDFTFKLNENVLIQKILKPKGISGDGMIHVHNKLEMGAGKYSIAINAKESGDGGKLHEKIFSLDMAPGSSRVLDFNGATGQFFIHPTVGASAGTVP